MANEVLGECPVCGRSLEISQLHCDYCDTTLEGHFTLCKFCRLSKEQRQFIEAFIKCRGNIREVEKELGVSYPTVRNRLDSVLATLGYTSPEKDRVDEDERKAVIEMLDAGELDYEQALKLLKKKEV